MDTIYILFSFAVSLTLLIASQKIFLSKNIVDKINDRSSHSSISTRSGGISIFLTLFIISCYFYINGYTIFNYSLIIPLSLLMVVGLYDDINGIDFKLKFIFQIIAAKIIIDNGLIIDNLHGFAGFFEINRVIAQLLTIFIILAIINAINFIDGIDGLAISITALFILSFEFFSISITPYINLSQIILSALIPLYYFNFRKKNKVFLGDSGSLFLGGIISVYVITILSNDYIIRPEFDLHKILFVFSILFFPIFDITRVVFFRLRRGKSPFFPDKNHIHHKILEIVKRHDLVVLIILTISVFFLFLIQILSRLI